MWTNLRLMHQPISTPSDDVKAAATIQLAKQLLPEGVSDHHVTYLAVVLMDLPDKDITNWHQQLHEHPLGV